MGSVTTRTLCSRKHLRLERTLYIPEEIDKIIRFRAVEEDKCFSNIVEDCFRTCFDKELKEYKKKEKKNQQSTYSLAKIDKWMLIAHLSRPSI
jgi:hypothetical protein